MDGDGRGVGAGRTTFDRVGRGGTGGLGATAGWGTGTSALGLIVMAGSGASEENVCSSVMVPPVAVRRWFAFRIKAAKVTMPRIRPTTPRACQPSKIFTRIQRRNGEALRCTGPTSLPLMSAPLF